MNTDLKLLPELHAAIRRGLYHDVRSIINSIQSVNIRDPERRTALVTCCCIEQEEWAIGIVRMLLENEAKVGLTDRQGRNALMYACVYQRDQLISLFLKAIDFDIDDRDRYGNTALFYAASTGNNKITNVLVEKMLRFKLGVDQVNNWGMSALMEASRLGHTTCANILISDGKASEELRDRVCGKNAREWLQEYERLEKLVEPVQRKRLQRRTQQTSEISKNMLTQFELKSNLKHEQERPKNVRSVSRVTNRVRVQCVKRNWIQDAIGDDVINTKFQTCLYINPVGNSARLQDASTYSTTSSITSSTVLPRINHWRGDFRKMYKQFEVLVSSSYRTKAINNTNEQQSRPLSAESTNPSIKSAKSSNRNNQAPNTGGSSESTSPTKHLLKKAEMSFIKSPSNHQIKSKRDDASSTAVHMFTSAVRRRNLTQQ